MNELQDLLDPVKQLERKLRMAELDVRFWKAEAEKQRIQGESDAKIVREYISNWDSESYVYDPWALILLAIGLLLGFGGGVLFG